MYTTSSIVYVGQYPCSIIEHLSSSEVLTCLTSPGAAGSYFVSVLVGGNEDAVTYWGFSYRNDYTPTLKAIVPSAGPPGTDVMLLGDATWYMQYRDCVEANWGDTSCIGSIIFGDYLCRQDPSDPNTDVNFIGNSRYGYGTLYSVGCSLPTPDDTDQPALGVAERVNATVHFEASLMGGAPVSTPASFLYDAYGNPYQFQLYAEVSGVTPAIGSNAGGTLLKLTGRGFPDLSLGLPMAINVSVSGVPCTIVNSTYDTAFCVTGPKPAVQPDTAIPIGGLYPGMRGVEFEYYNTQRNMYYNSLWQLNKTIFVNNTSGSFKTVLTGAWEDPYYTVSYHCTRMKAFFRAPRLANYSFYMSADDYGQLNATWLQGGAETKRSLVNITSWTYIDQWLSDSRMRGPFIELTAGQHVLLESAHCNGPSVGGSAVGMRMTVPQAQLNSIAEIQTITVAATQAPKTVLVKYLYGAGANTTAYDVLLMSYNDAALDNPQLGLEVLFNGGNRSVVLPVTATTAEMDNLVEAVLGGAFTAAANDSLFGVSKARMAGLLTLTFAADKSAGPFEITWARLVTLPPPAVGQLAGGTCAAPSPSPLVTGSFVPPALLPPGTTDATGGVLLVIRPSQPVPSALPDGGSFQLGTSSGSVPLTLSYDTNATVMRSAVYNLTGYDCSVSVNSAWRDGGYVGRVWTITFPQWAYNSPPDLVIGPASIAPPGVHLDAEIRPANPPVTGGFRLAYGSSCSSVALALTDTSDTWKKKLGSLPGMSVPQRVDISGSGSSGYTFTITFDPIGNPGDLPPLRVADISGLGGVNPYATVTTVRDGSTDAFWGPIPTEFLRLAVGQPGTLDVAVNDVPSSCADPSGICGFAFSDAVTPIITSVSPAVLTFDAVSSLPLTITGTLFDQGTGVEVRVGAALCNVTSLSATQIVVSVPDTAPAGVRLVTVNVHNLGFATGAQNVTLKTLFVTGSQPSPAVVATAGWSVLNFTGKGFDSVNCSNNRFFIDAAPCGVVACNSSSLTVLYPGNLASSIAAAKITAQVYEGSTLIDSDSPASPTVQVTSSAAAITAVSPANMPGAGGLLTITLGGTPASAIRTAYMVPYISATSNYTMISAAFKARVPCANVTASGSSAFTCVSPALPNGKYQVLAVLDSKIMLLSPTTVAFDFVITSVSPNLGSIGGGTLVTITGSGFATSDPTLNSVFIKVPVSTTFLNGIIQCTTKSVNATHLVCETQPHLAANADADDPFARNVLPVATERRPIDVVICDANYNNSLLRQWCWSMDTTARARLAPTEGAAVDFGYATTLTPYIISTSPNRGAGGDAIQVSGYYMSDVSTVQFMLNGLLVALGTNVWAGDAGVSLNVPDLPPGVYTVVLRKANGEYSVDPSSAGVFTYVPTILQVRNQIGSLAGGLELTLTVGGAGLDPVGGNLSLAMAANQVDIAGLPCPVTAITGRNQISCRTPGVNGYVFAEYWNLAVSTYSMPDLISFTQPRVARYERTTNFQYQYGSPQPGVIQSDFFGARFTFYYQIAQMENVSYYLASDDASLLYIDDELIGSRSAWLPVTLSPGVHKFVITYVEYTGWASLQLLVGSPNSYSYVQWQKVTPVPPGAALPVDLTVNGVAAESLCGRTTVSKRLAFAPELAYESPDVILPNASCSFVYTAYRTPTLDSVKGVASSGILPPSFAAADSKLSIVGTFLTDPSLPAINQINVTLANRTCIITDISPYDIITTTNTTTVTTDVNGTLVSTVVPVNSTYTTTRITCIAPPLPAGTWNVSLMVAGIGLTRPTASSSTELPVVTYSIKVNGITSPPAQTTGGSCLLSIFGGGTVTVNGYGFVRGLVDKVLNVTQTAAWATSPCGTWTASTSSPACAALNAGQLNITPVSSDGFTAVFRLSRYAVPNPGAFAGNNSANSMVVRFKPQVFNMTNNVTNANYFTTDLYLCGGRTPALSNISPASVAPNVGNRALSLTWSFSGMGSQNTTILPGVAGAASNATIEFQVGPTVLPCANTTVSASTIGATTYSEAVTCQMPTYMPAATYVMWLCVQPFGCGLQADYTVPLTVSGISATRGSSAGGIVVVVTGNGFDLNSTLTAARFGNISCAITSSNATTLVCLTGGLDAKPDSPVTFPLSVTPTAGAAESTYPGFTFTFDPALEATASSIFPRRGSTEGGTAVTISGADFVPGVPTKVTIGGTPCTSVVVVSSTAITCVTGKPPSSILRVPLPVAVFQEGRGLARSSASYQYIDLWSRNTTWGGGPLPGYEDSVVIPEGITVLLDMSPPKLYILVLEGNLIFDEEQPYLNLQAHYIIVKGGNFTIGSAAKPYPGRANITMHGAPNSRDLPMYGAKALAVRQGLVSFYGQPKTPIYTKLNGTVHPGETQITVNGAINWQVGDRIVIASSSFYAYEVHEATIVALDGASVPGCTVITLDTPTRYTHLGEIHMQDGVATPLDMRAEVAVLTRNIVLQGDWTSAKNMYGVQVMVNSPRNMPRALVQFDNIEITQSGQAFRLGRYSMHWHMHGDVGYKSWVRGCAIHHTYNRAITIHGTHRAIIQNTLAYNTMGHTFFLEDGIESGNLIEGNIGLYTKVSDALLNTDTTPATFWITNPNNTVRNNVAAGSAAYGYWYRMLDNPEGPSYTTTVCPKFTPLLEFTNNTAHSNMFYGLRIHPEFYPRNNPCSGFTYGTFEQVPAVFNGLVSYKNGMKGVVCTQVGLVQLTNMVLGDNGGGPKQHIVNGKDHGGNMEMSWVVDDRNRFNVDLTQMAGLTNATIFARTSTGMQGTAAQWPSCRRVTGIISQSPVFGDPKHSALMSLINVTFVDFTGQSDCTLFSAMEACGKCKTYQGGSTTFTSGLSFTSSDASKRTMLSVWSWGHQGVYQDMDGTLLNSQTLPENLLPASDAGWSLGPNATWHSAAESELFDPKECVYVNDGVISNSGAFCSPALQFRRVMLNGHSPESIMYKDLLLTSLATNRTSRVHFTKYNEQGYQFTAVTGRDYWTHWDMPFRIDAETLTLHKMDLLNPDHFLYLSSKYIQVKNHFKVNGYKSNATTPPPALPTTPHGSFSYNKTLLPNGWYWGNYTYNDTKFTMLMAGRTDGTLNVAAYTCPDEGCNNLPDAVVDMRNGTLYWSDIATWNTSAINNFRKPQLGDNVTIPYGWNLVIDESPPGLSFLWVQGNVSFDPTKDVNLTANYVFVVYNGALRAGNATSPHPTKVTILLNGTRATPDYAPDNNVNYGSKVMAAFAGGTIELFGRPVNKPWIRLSSSASPGDKSITVSDPGHGWSIGDQILITSTTFNVWQTEFRTITQIANGGATLVLDSPLEQPHSATYKSYPNGGPTVDMRAEVGLVSSNILVTALDGPSTRSFGGEMFGARIVVSQKSVGRFSRIAMTYCGQGGLTDRACIFFDRLANLPGQTASSDSSSTAQPVINPSMVNASAILYGMNSNLRINGAVGSTDVSVGVAITNNVMYEAYDTHSVDVGTSGNLIQANLVLGTIKDMAGKSGFDIQMPSTFNILSAANFVLDNIAAGAERYGFAYYGLPCDDTYAQGVFVNNTAHSCLAGLWLRSSDASRAVGCTLLKNFTTYMNWDFGVISTRGITTDVILRNINILDTKHTGIHLMRANEMPTPSWLRWEGGLLAGQSSPAVCSACASLSDIGCHKKLSVQSFNRYEPFTPARGLESAQFALGFAVGPEKKPYDKPMGYSTIHGVFNITGITIADFYGKGGCGGADVGSYALANHPKAPEAFFPHYFSQINVVNVATGMGQGMFYHTPPDPDWRNEADCGEAFYTRDDGSQIPLNCAGPAHIYWRDLDGTLTNNVGTTAGLFPSGPRVFPMDQGSPVIPGPCTYSSVLDSYSCSAGSSNFLLDPRLKPNPIPASGIWGDPQHFVLESRDKDSEDRNFGPVFFNVSGSIDLVSAAMDHGWCFAYTCQKRLSTFWTYVPTGQNVYINFTGTPSQNFRYWLPYADNNGEVILVVNMLYTLNRRFTWLVDSGRVMPLSQPPVAGDGTPHGSYFWDQGNTLLYVKMKGGQSVESRTESAVMISQSFAVSIDDFYNQKQMFLKNLAYAMGIDMDRVYVAKITAGSTRLNIGIEPSRTIAIPTIPEPKLKAAVDPTDPVDPNDASSTPTDTTGGTTDNTAATNAAILADLVNAWNNYVRVVTDPNAANILGIQPIGFPSADWGGVAGAPTTGLPGTGDLPPSPPPPSPPPPSPPPTTSSGGGTTPTSSNPPVTGNPNSGTDNSGSSNAGGGSGGGGSGSGSGSAGSSSSGGIPIIAVIGGIVGGVIVVAIVIAILVVRRRRAKRLRPADSPDNANTEPAGDVNVAADALAAAPTPVSPVSPDGARNAFVQDAPAPAATSAGGQEPPAGYETPSERARRRLAAVDASAEPVAADDGLPTPRTASLAAGPRSPSQPQLIRPLVSTAMFPHSSMPLVPAPEAPIGPVRERSSAAFARESTGGTKAPASLADDAEAGAAGAAAAAAPPAPQAMARPRSPAGGVTSSGGSQTGTPRASSTLAPVPSGDEDGGNGDTVRRALDTSETMVPRSRSAVAAGQLDPVRRDSLPITAGPDGLASRDLAASGGGGAAPAATLAPTPAARGSALPPLGVGARPSLVLPGGTMEMMASASLLRSDVAALMVDAGPQGSEAGGSSTPAARTPAGLRSDSMRERD